MSRFPPIPNRELGQHFLVDENILRVIERLAELDPDDVVLEVGAGLGVLTTFLAERVAAVVAGASVSSVAGASVSAGASVVAGAGSSAAASSPPPQPAASAAASAANTIRATSPFRYERGVVLIGTP